MILLSLYFLTKDVNIGICYLVFTAVSFSGLKLLTSNFYKSVYFVIIFFTTAAYFIRPIILVDCTNCFMYPKVASLTGSEDIAKALWDAILGFICLSTGFILFAKSFRVAPRTIQRSD